MISSTRNKHKLAEMAISARSRAAALPPEVELPPESGETFAANALTARAARYALPDGW